MTTKVEKTIAIDVPIDTCYNQWTQFEQFPQFMSGVKEVKQIDDSHVHWVAEIGGVKREWDASILEQVPNEKIAWAAQQGATNAGAVYFNAAGPLKTEVTLCLEYEPEGFIENVGDKLGFVESQAQSDLVKFKELIEAQGFESGAWNGSINADANTTPSVLDARASQGDSGKAGISGKAAAAGAVLAGAAAVGLAKSKSNDSTPVNEATMGGADGPPAPTNYSPTTEVTMADTANYNQPGLYGNSSVLEEPSSYSRGVEASTTPGMLGDASRDPGSFEDVIARDELKRSTTENDPLR